NVPRHHTFFESETVPAGRFPSKLLVALVRDTNVRTATFGCIAAAWMVHELCWFLRSFLIGPQPKRRITRLHQVCSMCSARHQRLDSHWAVGFSGFGLGLLLRESLDANVLAFTFCLPSPVLRSAWIGDRFTPGYV